MKKFWGLFLLLLFAACLTSSASANSWGLSGRLLQAVMKEEAWSDYTLIGNQEDPFAVLHSRYHNALFFADQQKQLHVYTTAVYQPEDKRGNPELFYDGHYFSISYGENEFYTFCDWEENDVYQLSEAHIGDFWLIGIPEAGGYLSFTAEDDEDSGSYRFPGKILLSEFNIKLFPHSVAEIRHLNYMRARFDSGLSCLGSEPETGNLYSPDWPGKLLQPKKNGTAPVYSAPYGKSAWRAGKGKAAVGLKGTLWLLSRYRNEDGVSYACIRYNVSERTQRVGYALCSDLGLPEVTDQSSDPGSSFVHIDVVAAADTFLTDDPNVSQYPQFTVPEGTCLSCLGLYNGDYAYVSAEVRDGRFTDGGSIVWGFVPVRDLEPMEREKLQDVMDHLAGDWMLDSSGSLAASRLSLSADGTFRSGSLEEEDAEEGALSGVWYITAYNPFMNLYWNEPSYELTLLCDDGGAAVRGLALTEDGFCLSDRESSGRYVPAILPGAMTPEQFRDKWGLQDNDLYGYYRQMIDAKGPFDAWPAEDQYRFAALLEDVIRNQSVRTAVAAPGWIDTAEVAPEITQWRYALPETASVSREEAVEHCTALLRNAGALDGFPEGALVTASLYSGHWCCDSFDSPWWVVRFYRAPDDRLTEVWLNAGTGESPLHDTAAVLRHVREASPASAEILSEFSPTDLPPEVTAVYLDDSRAWHILVDLEGYSLREIFVDDETLEITSEDTSNG